MEGVREAQDFGVRVVLVGIEAANTYISQSLIREADDVHVLDSKFLSPHIQLAAQVPTPEQLGRDPRQVGTEYASRWLSQATPDEIAACVAGFPRIPHEMDRELLAWGRRNVARELSHEQMRELREGVREALRQASGQP